MLYRFPLLSRRKLTLENVKVLAAGLYQLFEGGNVAAVSMAAEKLVGRVCPRSFAALWKTGVLQLLRKLVGDHMTEGWTGC